MNRIARVVPSILAEDPEVLDRLLRCAETFTDFVQVDIMDGRFVPTRSVTCHDIVRACPNLRWEVHLMVKQPEEHLACYARSGAEKIVFHVEATSAPLRAIKQIRRLGVKVGLAVNPGTPLSNIILLTDHVDSVLFMTVHPGFYGAPFLPEVLEKVAELRSRKPNLEIGVDGGIKEGNVVTVAGLGVDYICVGSAIFMQPDPAACFHRLRHLVQKSPQFSSDVMGR